MMLDNLCIMLIMCNIHKTTHYTLNTIDIMHNADNKGNTLNTIDINYA